MLDFPSSTDVGRLAPSLEENDAGSELSAWELRDRREREDVREAEVQELGADGKLDGWAEPPLVLPMSSAEEE